MRCILLFKELVREVLLTASGKPWKLFILKLWRPLCESIHIGFWYS